MALEQVLSDRDSEDEVDDDIADLEDRRVSLKVLPNSFFFFTSFSSFACQNDAFGFFTSGHIL